MKSVGAYEAKTHFPKLLGRVAKGETIEITRHGVAVARLVPTTPPQRDIAETIRKLKAFRKRNTLGGLSIRDMINEGRKY